jgi:hypothetical protein
MRERVIGNAPKKFIDGTEAPPVAEALKKGIASTAARPG